MSKREEKSLTDKREAVLNYKKEVYKVRVTTYLQSTLKDDFLEDCINKRKIEASTAKNIIEIHYAMMDELPPSVTTLEFKALKKYLVDKIKLK
jgi:hypothetical protein